MTQPTPPDEQTPLGALSVTAALALIAAHADDVLALEHRFAARATAPVRTAAVAVSRFAARQWVTRFGSLQATSDPIGWSDLVTELLRELAERRPDPSHAVVQAVADAAALGTRQAARTLAQTLPMGGVPTSSTARAALAVRGTVEDRYARAETLLRAIPGETHQQVVTALAPVHGAVSDVDRDTRTLVNTAVADVAQNAAVGTGAQLLWIAERDACLVCAALSGEVVDANKDFPAALTFGRRPVGWYRHEGGLLRPPRHPHCRCRCEPWLGHVGPGISLPAALKREAQRSILSGDHLPSESEPERIRAADRLLGRGTALPKTVQARARAAVARGHFDRRAA